MAIGIRLTCTIQRTKVKCGRVLPGIGHCERQSCLRNKLARRSASSKGVSEILVCKCLQEMCRKVAELCIILLECRSTNVPHGQVELACEESTTRPWSSWYQHAKLAIISECEAKKPLCYQASEGQRGHKHIDVKTYLIKSEFSVYCTFITTNVRYTPVVQTV